MESILYGILSNALYDLLLFASAENALETVARQDDQVSALSASVISDWALDEFNAELSLEGANQLKALILGPEFRTLCQQVLASVALGELAGPRTTLISHLDALLRVQAPIASRDIENLTARTWAICVDAATTAMLQTDDNAELASALNNAIRTTALHEQLDSIGRSLDSIARQTQPSFETIVRFEQTLREQIRERHNSIIPPQFDTARRVPLDDIFVPLRFVPNDTRIPVTQDITDIFSESPLAVILGDPGGGKTTLAHKLCVDLASAETDGPSSSGAATPFLVTVREYGRDREARDASILQYLEARVSSHYQMELVPGALEFMLLNGRALVVFDGLDELLDTTTRQQITLDIEAFVRLYPNTRVVVTSRQVGYDQAPLDSSRFAVYRLAAFSTGQIEEYVGKWFAGDSSIPDDEAQSYAAHFMEQSEFVPDLRENPLLLALMCTIFRGEYYLPRNRPELYEKCAIMLFERWDQSRNIRPSLRIEASLSPAMKHLAHWIYSTPGLDMGVTEHRLINEATRYLREWRFDNTDEAEAAARGFVEFCRGRAWVFTDVGTTGDGVPLYQFTHRTFLEYFTASHLTRKFETPAELLEVLQEHIGDASWDVVSQLAVQIQDRNLEGAGDRFLADLLESVDESTLLIDDRESNKVAFAARCLSFLVPKPATCAEVAVDVIEKLCTVLLQFDDPTVSSFAPQTAFLEETSTTPYGGRERAHTLLAAFTSLLGCSWENRDAVRSSLDEHATRVMNAGRDARRSAMLGGLLAHAGDAVRVASSEYNRQAITYWDDYSDQFVVEHSGALVQLVSFYPALAPCVLAKQPDQFARVLDHTSIDMLFGSPRMIPLLGSYYAPLCESMIDATFGLSTSGGRVEHETASLRSLAELVCDYLLHRDPPWFDAGEVERLKYQLADFIASPLRGGARDGDDEALSKGASPAARTAATILMVSIASNDPRTAMSALSRSRLFDSAFVEAVATLLRCRIGELSFDGAHADVIAAAGLNAPGVSVCGRWARGEVDFLQER